MNNQPDPESSVRERLNQIKSVPARNPQVAARARARFLAEAVAASEARRNKGWGFIFRKQQFALNLVVALVVIVGLFAGGGTTVRAAQDDLPNEPLYPIKMLSEDISLRFENDPEAKVDRLMELTQTRIQEMARMVEAGQTPPERVRLRLEQHLQQTFQLCSNMNDADLDQKLPQLQGQLRKYEQDMQALQAQSPQGEQPVLEHTRIMLRAQLQLVDHGLANHEVFRETVRSGFHAEQTQTPPTAEPTATPLIDQEQVVQTTPQPGNQENNNGLGPDTNPSGQNAHVTPTPKNDNNGVNSGNNPGNKDKDKVKDEKENGPENKENKGKNPK